MKLLRLPVVWGTVAGIIVGFFGIPLPEYLLQYPGWIHPVGFHTSSLLLFSVLGFLVGYGVQSLLRIQMGRKVVMRTIGTSCLALLIGLVGIYRLEGNHQGTMGHLGYLGVIDTGNAAAHLSQESVSSSDAKIQGAVMLKAAADLGAYGMLARGYGFKPSEINEINTVASALNEAGVSLESTDQKKALVAKNFIVNAGNIIGTYQKSHQKPGENFAWTRTKILAVMRNIESIRPDQYRKQEPVN